MIAAVCIDDNSGMLFNHRRQSQDRILREDLLREAAGGPLWVNAYSAKQFREPPDGLRVSPDFLSEAGPGPLALGGEAGEADRLPLEPDVSGGYLVHPPLGGLEAGADRGVRRFLP